MLIIIIFNVQKFSQFFRTESDLRRLKWDINWKFILSKLFVLFYFRFVYSVMSKTSCKSFDLHDWKFSIVYLVFSLEPPINMAHGTTAELLYSTVQMIALQVSCNNFKETYDIVYSYRFYIWQTTEPMKKIHRSIIQAVCNKKRKLWVSKFLFLFRFNPGWSNQSECFCNFLELQWQWLFFSLSSRRTHTQTQTQTHTHTYLLFFSIFDVIFFITDDFWHYYSTLLQSLRKYFCYRNKFQFEVKFDNL